MSKFIESGRTKLIVEPFTLTWWKTKLIRLIVVVAIPYNTINLVLCLDMYLCLSPLCYTLLVWSWFYYCPYSECYHHHWSYGIMKVAPFGLAFDITENSHPTSNHLCSAVSCYLIWWCMSQEEELKLSALCGELMSSTSFLANYQSHKNEIQTHNCVPQKMRLKVLKFDRYSVSYDRLSYLCMKIWFNLSIPAINP